MILFQRYLFVKGKKKQPVVSIAIAGPQSSGKSTLLRRLFGIDAKASAGRTTKGINCCRIACNDKEIILISDQKEADSGTKKDNKIILGSLASSRVFILNFMRSGNICSIRQLADIKFVFLIRDCAEYNNDGWLEKQKQEISDYLQNSLKSSPKYIESTKDVRIEDVIGQPLWFPILSAMNPNGTPNFEFAKRVLELRKIITAYLDDRNC
ncbi:hypothetical protein RFI_24680 [Reticulomyxa filosa]|uniref:Guanylate-binding protein N-terminal domain-containing protein n=1 Tax=Reticulomyxa filosa TaxID=46433 RepID=X6MFL0_RETFI|nr:hypothetical protein RFI_24680 [Reticulomyxa filosa]|eukprot:ETO12694.1 hypothetical protein RFI_24680 [Reticulomyxa filosa]